MKLLSKINCFKCWKLSLAFLICLVLSQNITIAEEYQITDNSKITADISARGVNRIAVKDDRITEVIGNDQEYIVESEANLGQIFMTPSLKVGKVISVQLITEREKIIDAKFNVKDIEPQTIIFKYKPKNLSKQANSLHLSAANTDNLYQEPIKDLDHKQEVIELIRLAYVDKIEMSPIKSLICLAKDYGLITAKETMSGAYKIIKAKISSKNNKNKVVEQDFKTCLPNLVAIAIDEHASASSTNQIIELYLVGY